MNGMSCPKLCMMYILMNVVQYYFLYCIKLNLYFHCTVTGYSFTVNTLANIYTYTGLTQRLIYEIL